MGGVTSSLHEGESIGTHLAAAVKRMLPELADESAHEVVRVVLEALLSDPVRSELARAMTDAQIAADAAFSLRDDLYDSWDGPEPRARLSLRALDELAGRRSSTMNESAEDAAALLRRVTYKPNWSFEVCALPGGPVGVRVEARGLVDAGGGHKAVGASRRVWDRGSVLANALGAVEVLEIHEAREQFRVDGDAVFNEHRARADGVVVPERDAVEQPRWAEALQQGT